MALPASSVLSTQATEPRQDVAFPPWQPRWRRRRGHKRGLGRARSGSWEKAGFQESEHSPWVRTWPNRTLHGRQELCRMHSHQTTRDHTGGRAVASHACMWIAWCSVDGGRTGHVCGSAWHREAGLLCTPWVGGGRVPLAAPRRSARVACPHAADSRHFPGRRSGRRDRERGMRERYGGAGNRNAWRASGWGEAPVRHPDGQQKVSQLR